MRSADALGVLGVLGVLSAGIVSVADVRFVLEGILLSAAEWELRHLRKTELVEPLWLDGLVYMGAILAICVIVYVASGFILGDGRF